MLLRTATAADAAAVTDIYNQAVLTTTASFDIEPKSVENRRQWLVERPPRHPVIVAEQDGEVVAWGALSRFSERPAYDATTEISIYVDGAHHRQGLGRALTIALLDAAPGLGLHSILARICTENAGSIALVRSLGFVEAGTVHEVGRKFGRWLDVVTWEYRVPGDAGCHNASA